MEGTFKGWIKDRGFGYIVPDDGSDDVFLHASATPHPDMWTRGTRLHFEIEVTPKGRAAVDVLTLMEEPQSSALEGPTKEGHVKFWTDRGFGFIEPADGGDDVFVHSSALPAEANGYLSDGDVVEYAAEEEERGLAACALRVIGWRPPEHHLGRFADLGRPGWLKRLADLAEQEPWEYTHSSSAEAYPILRSYLRYTFRRLEGIRSPLPPTGQVQPSTLGW